MQLSTFQAIAAFSSEMEATLRDEETILMDGVQQTVLWFMCIAFVHYGGPWKTIPFPSCWATL